MLELIIKMAMQKLAEKMGPNSLGQNETQNAASEGASELINRLTQGIGGGQLSQITSLFSNDGNSTESNPVFQGIQSKLGEILQNQGMSAQDAQAEAQNTAPDLINSLKDKFLSQDEADKGFDLGAIAEMAGGAGGILNIAKKLF
ncbi:hypothetical protein N9595_03355 [Bacteroidia bacterium]|nr:hypothetical protein [Bacteroidia bacterium]